MNVELPKKYKLKKRDIAVYSVAIFGCILALVVIVIMQVMGDDVSNRFFGTNKAKRISEEEEVKLKTDFENMFTNTFTGEIENVKRLNNTRDIVYTYYQNQENDTQNYTLNVNIPQFNIQNDNLEKVNKEIEDIYRQKTDEILNSKGNKIVYSVEYVSFVENGVLSLAIRSNLKQGTNAQQVMLNTYNYDLQSGKIISLDDMINKLELNKTTVQELINTKIKEEEESSKAFKDLGYNIYVRDSNDEMYKLQNSNLFFALNGKLYVIYAYGNTTLTSEMDVVVI